MGIVEVTHSGPLSVEFKRQPDTTVVVVTADAASELGKGDKLVQVDGRAVPAKALGLAQLLHQTRKTVYKVIRRDPPNPKSVRYASWERDAVLDPGCTYFGVVYGVEGGVVKLVTLGTSVAASDAAKAALKLKGDATFAATQDYSDLMRLVLPKELNLKERDVLSVRGIAGTAKTASFHADKVILGVVRAVAASQSAYDVDKSCMYEMRDDKITHKLDTSRYNPRSAVRRGASSAPLARAPSFAPLGTFVPLSALESNARNVDVAAIVVDISFPQVCKHNMKMEFRICDMSLPRVPSTSNLPTLVIWADDYDPSRCALSIGDIIVVKNAAVKSYGVVKQLNVYANEKIRPVVYRAGEEVVDLPTKAAVEAAREFYTREQDHLVSLVSNSRFVVKLADTFTHPSDFGDFNVVVSAPFVRDASGNYSAQVRDVSCKPGQTYKLTTTSNFVGILANTRVKAGDSLKIRNARIFRKHDDKTAQIYVNGYDNIREEIRVSSMLVLPPQTFDAEALALPPPKRLKLLPSGTAVSSVVSGTVQLSSLLRGASTAPALVKCRVTGAFPPDIGSAVISNKGAAICFRLEDSTACVEAWCVDAMAFLHESGATPSDLTAIDESQPKRHAEKMIDRLLMPNRWSDFCVQKSPQGRFEIIHTKASLATTVAAAE